MYKPSIEQLKKVLTKKGYPIKTGEWELNIIGIRNDNAKPNSFDDTICVLFKDHYGDDTLITFSCTTDAGIYWLLHPLNVDGCIIMKEGHYPDVYKVGLHRGYKALEQCGKIHYVRDNNKDAVLDFDSKNEVFGNFKTNIHHASMPEQSISVDKWSAGCQVINKGWLEFLELCEKSVLVTERNLFSYTLINIRDVQYA
ncbi:MAG: hypothetical protein IPG89_07200 [Bacteroidetes bacterium]|nr:hypothetical protein [Bacteroidota bacterium]